MEFTGDLSSSPPAQPERKKRRDEAEERRVGEYFEGWWGVEGLLRALVFGYSSESRNITTQLR